MPVPQVFTSELDLALLYRFGLEIQIEEGIRTSGTVAGAAGYQPAVLSHSTTSAEMPSWQLSTTGRFILRFEASILTAMIPRDCLLVAGVRIGGAAV